MLQTHKKRRTKAIRKKKKNVYMWEIADALNITPTWLSNKFRHELEEDEKTKIIKLIDDISESVKP